MFVDLNRVREHLLQYSERLLDRDGPYGCYRTPNGGKPDLYATCDIALMRAIMGEDLTALPKDKREQWIAYINSFINQTAKDGRYTDTYGHSALHANGMVISALGALGGRQPLPVRLYDAFDTVNSIESWLEQIDWVNQWQASHLFWGGMIAFSFSSRCRTEWLDAVIAWLDRNLDPATGWWRVGVPHADRHQPLGGSVHILPIYQHHGYAFPYPEKVIDSVLGMQLPAGRWLNGSSVHVVSYLELDALYALSFMRQLAPAYRKDEIQRSVSRYADLVERYYEEQREGLYQFHPHPLLAVIGTLGLLQQFEPERFRDDRMWTDIFNDPRFYRTSDVEIFE